jgi:hypothetical protein
LFRSKLISHCNKKWKSSREIFHLS